MRIKLSGLLIAGVWILLTILLANSLFSLITPKEVDLTESKTCSESTSQECLQKETLPRATEEIQKSLINSLTETQRTTAIFSFPLGILEFEQVIENRDSRIEFRISQPEYVETVLPNAQISCNFREQRFTLEKRQRYRTREYIQLYLFADQDLTAAKKNVADIAKSIADGYLGCDWVPVDISVNPKPGEIIAGPNATVSFVKIINPFLIFVPTWTTLLIVYFGIFGLLGALIALLKQFLEILVQGFEFFTGENTKGSKHR